MSTSELDARWPLPSTIPAPPDVCPAADTGVCGCDDCATARTRERLLAMASSALRRSDIAAWIGRATDVVHRHEWQAEVESDDGRVYVRCRAKSPEDAAQLVVAVITGSAP